MNRNRFNVVVDETYAVTTLCTFSAQNMLGKLFAPDFPSENEQIVVDKGNAAWMAPSPLKQNKMFIFSITCYLFV